MAILKKRFFNQWFLKLFWCDYLYTFAVKNSHTDCSIFRWFQSFKGSFKSRQIYLLFCFRLKKGLLDRYLACKFSWIKKISLYIQKLMHYAKIELSSRKWFLTLVVRIRELIWKRFKLMLIFIKSGKIKRKKEDSKTFLTFYTSYA